MLNNYCICDKVFAAPHYLFLWYILVTCENISDDAVLPETCVFKEAKTTD